jgi:hypothetical protein
MPRISRQAAPWRTTRLIVHRRCCVCEWEADQIEVPHAQLDCPWCHAPTAIAETPRQGEAPNPAGHAKNPHAAALGRLGGLKGGPARAARLTARERRDSARRAALARCLDTLVGDFGRGCGRRLRVRLQAQPGEPIVTLAGGRSVSFLKCARPRGLPRRRPVPALISPGFREARAPGGRP